MERGLLLHLEEKQHFSLAQDSNSGRDIVPKILSMNMLNLKIEAAHGIYSIIVSLKELALGFNVEFHFVLQDSAKEKNRSSLVSCLQHLA
jgi:hypothetical protein